MSLLRSSLLWASQNPWLQRELPRRAFVRRAVKRFMPGEEAADALAACEAFQRRRIGAVVTLLGENVRDASEARAVVTHYAGVLDEIERRGLDVEISLKPTHLGLDLGPEVAFASLRDLAAAAAAYGRTVWIDMEGSAYTQATIDLYRRVRALHPHTGLCLQAYLRRTALDLEALLQGSPMIRLVKGAYAEPPAIAFANKAEVDASFLGLATRLLEVAAGEPRVRVGIATHDRRLIQALIARAHERRVPQSAYEFQMLYGIQREEQLRLAASGYRVRVLISYGSAWFPWYMRRLAERPANLGFVLRNLVAK